MFPLRTNLLAAASLGLTLLAHAADVAVSIENFNFVPGVVVIQPGDTVTWTYNDAGARHNVASTSPGEIFTSPDLRVVGETFAHTFTTGGVHPYVCDYHSGMGGTVIVATGTVVRIENFAFVPADVTISPGEQVTWANLDPDRHTSTAGMSCTPSGGWDSGILGQHQTFRRTFSAAGVFDYYCDPHCSFMTGVVRVGGSPGMGACCNGAACTVTTQAGCTGTYQGDGTSCAANPCQPPAPLTVYAVKDPTNRADVLFVFNVGANPSMLHRGTRMDLPNLPMLKMIPPASDPGVVPVPPDYYYQAQ